MKYLMLSERTNQPTFHVENGKCKHWLPGNNNWSDSIKVKVKPKALQKKRNKKE